MAASSFSEADLQRARRQSQRTSPEDIDPKIEALVKDLIGRVADKWTMLILEVMTENEKLRFTQLSREVVRISQKMLTQTLRHMERDGMVSCKVHAVSLSV